MKIAVLVSGGVDSALALCLLKEQGYDLTAFYLKIWLEDELDDLAQCPWQEDLEYVEKTCDILQVPYRVLPLQREYKEQILTYTLSEVKRGHTPNPDLLCNNRIKFGVFYDKIFPLYEKVATGHYAGCRNNTASGRLELLCSPDREKDQTYFLAGLQQSQLRSVLFPLSHYTKQQVRSLAQEKGLPSSLRKDSQGLCFLGKVRFSDFIRRHLGEKTGELIEYESNLVLGEHRGFWFYTIGQRQGLGLSGGPWYVVTKDITTNRIYISRQYYTTDKHRDSFTICNLHWISGLQPKEDSGLKVKLRHGVLAYPCRLQALENGTATVRIIGRDQGIAPGQFAVFYKDDVCLGCARIRPAID